MFLFYKNITNWENTFNFSHEKSWFFVFLNHFLVQVMKNTPENHICVFLFFCWESFPRIIENTRNRKIQKNRKYYLLYRPIAWEFQFYQSSTISTLNPISLNFLPLRAAAAIFRVSFCFFTKSLCYTAEIFFGVVTINWGINILLICPWFSCFLFEHCFSVFPHLLTKYFWYTVGYRPRNSMVASHRTQSLSRVWPFCEEVRAPQ